MACYFLDTSALVKNYHVETGSAAVQQVFAQADSQWWISRLTTVEIVSAFAGKVRSREISVREFEILRRKFRTDVFARRLVPVRMSKGNFRTAAELIRKYGLKRQIRTLDAIQLAVAIDMHRSRPVDHFVCSDQRLCDVAALEGFAVIRP